MQFNLVISKIQVKIFLLTVMKNLKLFGVMDKLWEFVLSKAFFVFIRLNLMSYVSVLLPHFSPIVERKYRKMVNLQIKYEFQIYDIKKPVNWEPFLFGQVPHVCTGLKVSFHFQFVVNLDKILSAKNSLHLKKLQIPKNSRFSSVWLRIPINISKRWMAHHSLSIN